MSRKNTLIRKKPQSLSFIKRRPLMWQGILLSLVCAFPVLAISPAVYADTLPSDEKLDVVAANIEQQVLTTTPRQWLTKKASGTAAGENYSVALTGDGLDVVCSAKVNYPHPSAGAGGAIFKTDITCTGTGAAAVNVRQRGLLSFAETETSKPVERATSDYEQTISVNGTAKTYYTPQPGTNGGHGDGYWIATSTWQITAPALGTVGSDTVTIKSAI